MSTLFEVIKEDTQLILTFNQLMLEGFTVDRVYNGGTDLMFSMEHEKNNENAVIRCPDLKDQDSGTIQRALSSQQGRPEEQSLIKYNQAMCLS